MADAGDLLGPRWTDGPLLGVPGEEAARGLLRDAPPPPPLTDVASHRVLRKLRGESLRAAAERASTVAGGAGGRRWTLRPAVVAVLALAVAGAAAAASRVLWRGSHPAPAAL